MIFDPKKPFRQRNGRKAWLIADLREQGFPEAVEEPLIVGINTVDGRAYWAAYDADGVYRRSYNSGSDLINIPGKSCKVCKHASPCNYKADFVECNFLTTVEAFPPWFNYYFRAVAPDTEDYGHNCPCYEERAE